MPHSAKLAEFREFVVKMAEEKAAEEAKNFFIRMVRNNGDGTITYEEWGGFSTVVGHTKMANLKRMPDGSKRATVQYRMGMAPGDPLETAKVMMPDDGRSFDESSWRLPL
jgi:hypothetical protein